MSASVLYRNNVLQRLSPETIQRLDLKRMELPLRTTLAEPNREITHIVFVEEGVGSMTAVFTDGAEVEVSMFGCESVVGVSMLMGERRSLNRIFMQVGGHGFSTPMATARREFDRQGDLHRLSLRYVQTQLVQSIQNAACNAVHSAEQRLARWLLTVHDRANTDSFKFSHEFMAMMLGSTRATVTIAAGTLKERGLIDYHRGTMTILDVEALERHACECYGVVFRHLHNVDQFETGGNGTAS